MDNGRFFCPYCQVFLLEVNEPKWEWAIAICGSCKNWVGLFVCSKNGHNHISLEKIVTDGPGYQFLCQYPGCDNNVCCNKCVGCSKYKIAKTQFCQTCELAVNETKKIPKITRANGGVYFIGKGDQQCPLFLGKSDEYFHKDNFSFLSSLICRYVEIKSDNLTKRLDDFEKQQTERFERLERKLDEIIEIVTWMPGLQAASNTKESFESKLDKQEK